MAEKTWHLLLEQGNDPEGVQIRILGLHLAIAPRAPSKAQPDRLPCKKDECLLHITLRAGEIEGDVGQGDLDDTTAILELWLLLLLLHDFFHGARLVYFKSDLSRS